MRWPWVRRKHLVAVFEELQDQYRLTHAAEELSFTIHSDCTNRAAELEKAGLNLIGYYYHDRHLFTRDLVGVRKEDYDALVRVLCPPPVEDH